MIAIHKPINLFILPLLAIATAIGVVGLQWQQLQRLGTQEPASAEYYETQEDAEALRIQTIQNLPSLGFSNLVADWVFLQFIQYDGDRPAREETGYSLNPEYLEAIVEKDPRFVEAYSVLSSATSLSAGQPLETISLLEEALESLSPEVSEAYYVWVLKAIDEILFLGDTQAAQKSYEMAQKWAEAEATPRSRISAERFRETAEFLATDPEIEYAQIGAWLSVLSRTADERIQNFAVSQIEELGGEIIVSENGQVEVKVPKKE